MLSIYYFVFKNLVELHAGISFLTKIKAVVKVAFLFSLPAWFTSKIIQWSVSNQEYIAGVLVCIAIDHLIGSIYHAFKLHDFTFKKNVVGLLSKLALCAVAAILFEIIHSTIKDVSFIYDYLKTTTRLIIVLYPAGSAFMNMSALTNGVFPPLGWIRKIAAFNQNLDLQKLSSSNGSCNITQDKAIASQNQAGSPGSL